MTGSPGDVNKWSDLKTQDFGGNTLIKHMTWQCRKRKAQQITQALIVGLFGQIHLFRQRVLKPVLFPLSGKMLKRHISSFDLCDPDLISIRMAKEATFSQASQWLCYWKDIDLNSHYSWDYAPNDSVCLMKCLMLC